jgi:hypothetical protein
MADTIKGTLDTRAVKKVLADLSKSTSRRVLTRAFSTSSRRMQTAAVGYAYKRLNMKKADIRSAIKRARVSNKTGGEVRVVRKDVPLIQFRPRATKTKGVRFRIEKGGSETVLRHAFKATMPSGHTGIYERQYERKSYRGPRPTHSERPIRQLFAKQVILYLDEKDARVAILKVGEEVFVSELRRQVERITK